MRFGNPLLLLGLLAVAIPIVVHLVNRQRARRQPFPALEFLLRSNEKHARRLKLKQLMLLALRISVFVLLPLAMARPAAQCGGEGATTDARLPTSVVLVVDDSASMSAPARGGTAAERARSLAADAVRDLRAWDEVAVIMAGADATSTGDPSEERRPALDALEESAPGAGGSDLAAALGVAADLQRASRLPVQRTIVWTDGRAHAWPEAAAPDAWAGAGDLRFETIDVDDANCAITALTWGRGEDGAAGSTRFDAEVACEGDGPDRVAMTLQLDGEPAASASAELVEGRGVGSFAVRIDASEPVVARAALEPTSGPTADDERWAAWIPERRVRVLAVNGDPRSVAYNDELFYLRRALEAGAVDGRGAVVDVVPVDGLATASLDAADVVILANVGTLPTPQIERLEAFVEDGGGLLLSAGSQVSADRWNSVFAGLLPKPIRDVKVLAEPDAADAALLATRLSDIDALHPVFRVFRLPGGETVQSVLVYRYLLLVPDATSEARTVASYGDGGPALVERSVGRGRVMLWTTTLDLDWTDLPIRTAYLPLVRRTVDYLARRAGQSGASAEVGEPLSIDVSTLGVERLVVTAPSGARTVLPVDGDDVRFVPAEVGVHGVAGGVGEGDAAPIPELTFAANVPATEHAVARMDATTLEAWAASVQAAGAADGERGVEAGERPLWPLLLFVLLLVIYAETLVSVRRRVWQRARAWWAGVRAAR